MPKVSVIIPNYNHAAYLPQRLNSVLNQTLGDIEIVFLDDASTDESLEVIQPFLGDSRVKTLFNNENSGSTFVQWNRGVSAASGEYVWIAESDDVAAPDFLETLVAVLDGDKSLVLAYCQSQTIREDGQVEGIYSDYEAAFDLSQWGTDYTREGTEEIRRFLIIGNTIPNASAVVFRRGAFARMGGAPTQLKLCGDWLTWGRLLSQGRVAFHARPLNFFRVGAASSQRAKAKSQGLDVTEGFEVFLELAQTVGLIGPAYSKAFYWQVHRWAMYSIAYRFSPALNRKIWKLLSRHRHGRWFPFVLRTVVIFVERLFVAAYRKVFRRNIVAVAGWSGPGAATTAGSGQANEP